MNMQYANNANYDNSINNIGVKKLAPTANEFVPGRSFTVMSSQKSMNSLSSIQSPYSLATTYPVQPGNSVLVSVNTELNSAASEWMPTQDIGFQNASNSNDQTGRVLDSAANFESEATSELHWAGDSPSYNDVIDEHLEGGVINIEYVGETLEPEVGLDWANSSSTLPAPPKRTLQTIGIPEPIRQHFQILDIEALRQLKPDDEKYKEIPVRYHSAYNLDHVNVKGVVNAAGNFGYPSSTYKVIDRADSQIYTLKRFDNVRTTPAIVNNAFLKWKEIRHPGIVSLYSINAERSTLFLAYAYHPGAITLKQRFIDRRSNQPVPEALMSRIFVQIISAIRFVHSRGMAIRSIEPMHIILTSGTCARLSCVGVADILEFESRKSILELQVDDLIKLGRLLLSLATRTVVTNQTTTDALNAIGITYSADMILIIRKLLSGQKSVQYLCQEPEFVERIHDELDSASAMVDSLHSNLRNEYENGRLLRLLIKLGFTNERPDRQIATSNQWSETGDRYILKLFRDYVFHQNQYDGTPVLDAGHVLTALNKLDLGDPEEILLSARDSKDLFVVSYTDVQRCLEMSFMDLAHQADPYGVVNPDALVTPPSMLNSYTTSMTAGFDQMVPTPSTAMNATNPQAHNAMYHHQHPAASRQHNVPDANKFHPNNRMPAQNYNAGMKSGKEDVHKPGGRGAMYGNNFNPNTRVSKLPETEIRTNNNFRTHANTPPLPLNRPNESMGGYPEQNVTRTMSSTPTSTWTNNLSNPTNQYNTSHIPVLSVDYSSNYRGFPPTGQNDANISQKGVYHNGIPYPVPTQSTGGMSSKHPEMPVDRSLHYDPQQYEASNNFSIGQHQVSHFGTKNMEQSHPNLHSTDQSGYQSSKTFDPKTNFELQKYPRSFPGHEGNHSGMEGQGYHSSQFQVEEYSTYDYSRRNASQNHASFVTTPSNLHHR